MHSLVFLLNCGNASVVRRIYLNKKLKRMQYIILIQNMELKSTERQLYNFLQIRHKNKSIFERKFL